MRSSKSRSNERIFFIDLVRTPPACSMPEACVPILLKQFRFACRLLWFNYANLIHRILQHAGFDMAQRGNLARGAIGGFLDYMTGMTFRPLPLDAVARPRFIQALPPIVICLAAIRSFHRLDNVLRVGVHPHAARLFQSLQPQRRRRNLCLLIGRLAEIRSKRSPQPFVAKQSHRRRARRVATVAETRAVTIDGDKFCGASTGSPATRMSSLTRSLSQ